MTQEEKGVVIDGLIADITEQCAIIFPKTWETVAKKLLTTRNLTLTQDPEIQKLMQQLISLEDNSDNIYIQLLNNQ